MAARRKGAAHHIDQESRRGPDADSRHAGQDRMKRVSKYETFNFLCHLVALDAQSRKLLRQARQNDAGGLSAQNHDGLLRERLKDFCGPCFSHARREFDEPVRQLFLAQRGQLRGRGIALEQIEHGRVIQMRAHDALECGMDLCQKTADAIADLRDLACQILVKAAQHGELCELIVGQLQRAKRNAVDCGQPRQ